MIADKLAIAELMSTGVRALPPVVPVHQLLEVLRSCDHQARPSVVSNVAHELCITVISQFQYVTRAGLLAVDGETKMNGRAGGVTESTN